MKEHFCSAEKSMITYEGSCNWCGEREGSMTQDEIIEMAQECKLIGMRPFIDGIYTEALIEFAKLVASKEREACAKVCDELSDKHTWEGCYADECATAIRARGEQP
jgi:hypothetical protein